MDSGYTMRYLKNLLLSRKPASLEICVLLEKPSRLKVPVDLPPRLVVGFRMEIALLDRHPRPSEMTYSQGVRLLRRPGCSGGARYQVHRFRDSRQVGRGLWYSTTAAQCHHHHSHVTHTALVHVVCSGMDYDERYRCLPFIGVLKRSVYDSTFVVEAEATNSQ